MSHSHSPSTPAGSKAALLGSDPEAHNHEAAAPAVGTAPTDSKPADNPAQPLLGQAERWLSQGSVADLLGRVSPALKTSADALTARYRTLSTTQKVVGGAVLFWGVRKLLVGKSSKHSNGSKPRDRAEADTLDELLHFVNDREAGYQKAVEESKTPELRTYYQQLVRESQQFAQRLNSYLTRQGVAPQTGTTLKGKLYRRFMAAASIFTGHNEKAILASNVHGEQWASAAYEDALDSDDLRGEMRQKVERQHTASQATLRRLKQLIAR